MMIDLVLLASDAVRGIAFLAAEDVCHCLLGADCGFPRGRAAERGSSGPGSSGILGILVGRTR